MALEKFDKSNCNNKFNSDYSIDDILLTLKYPELIGEKSSTPEIKLKRGTMAIEKDISKRVNENERSLFRMYMELLNQEKNENYTIRYRPEIKGNKLGKFRLKTSDGTINMSFQTFIWREELGITCICDYTPNSMAIDKKIRLLKQLHKLINQKLGL